MKRPWQAWAGGAIVAAGGMLAAMVHAGVTALLAQAPQGTFGISQAFHVSPLPIGAVVLWITIFVPLFLIAWYLANVYVHRRTGCDLAGRLLRDAPIFLFAVPLLAFLTAFGPGHHRPRVAGTAILLFMVLLALKLWPMFAAAFTAGKPIRRRDLLALLMTLGIGLFVIDHPRHLTGDEPHYLVMTQSLLRDGDLELANNYDRGDYASYFRGPLEMHTTAVRNPATGTTMQRPIHYPGLSILVMPGYILAGANGAKFTLLAIGIVALMGFFILLMRFGASERLAAAGTLAVALTSPMITYSLQLYPEIITAAVLVLGLVLLTEPEFRASHALVLGIMLAALPWFHVRYAPIGLALGIGAVIRCGWRPRLGAIVVPPIVSVGALLIFYVAVYGGIHPAQVSNLPADQTYFGGLSLPRAIRYAFSLFLDSHGGLIAYAPALMLAPLGMFFAVGRRRLAGLVMAAAVAGQLGLIAAGWRSWHGDWSPPSRFAMCVFPPLALMAVLAYERVRGNAALRRLTLTLTAIGVLMGVLLIGDPESMYNEQAPGMIPSITFSYRLVRIGWVFPHFVEPTVKTYLLAGFWILAIATVTLAGMRAAKRLREGPARAA